MKPPAALPLAKHPPRSGARVLDVGCGRGESTFDLARLVGRRGSVVGLYTSEADVAAARLEARSADARNVSFVRAGGTSAGEELGLFDLAFARIGAAVFGDVASSLREVRGWLRPGGVLLGVAWRDVGSNPWASVTPEVARLQSASFSLADPDATRAMLDAAGYVGISLEPLDAPLLLGACLEDASASLLGTGQPDLDVRGGSAVVLAQALRPFVTARGVVMASSSWCITARSPS